MVKKIDFPIDFVVTWVDGSDPKWLDKKRNFEGSESNGGHEQSRFRDYSIFEYWFRAVEKYASWVNHIYLITDEQVPKWINTKYSKLTVIDHRDFIPTQYLPVFNSNAIEINVHRIEGLSENFVLFNDDMFLNNYVKASDFFDQNGKPKDTAGLNAIQPHRMFDYIYTNMMIIINNKFEKRKVMRRHFFKFFHPANGILNLYTFLLLFLPKFTRFFDLHYPYSLNKSLVDNVINENRDAYALTMNSRFRSVNDISIWLVRYYSLVTGFFSPRSVHFGKIYNLTQFDKMIKDIDFCKHKVIVINDDESINQEQFENLTKKMKNHFNIKLSKKSQFEK